MSTASQILDLRQSQNLVMTPQLQQAIKLLQLSNIELNEYVEEELVKNPFLEKDDRPEANTDAPEPPAHNAEGHDHGGDNADRSPDPPAEPTSQTGNDDFDAGTVVTGRGGDMRFETPEDSFENRMSRPETLREHLTEQLFLSTSDPRDHMIGSLLIDQLDESGYLRAGYTALADTMGCSPERIEKLLSLMKRFDPTGIFARDLKECLALQLQERDQLSAAMEHLLDNLALLGEHDFKKLASLCGVDEPTLQDMIADIRALNPKPASDFEHLVVQTVVPDVLMQRRPKNIGGGWRVELNSETLPRVLVNQEYFTEVKAKTKDKQEKEYLNVQLSSANWLVRAMDQRAQTILKTAAEIIEQQDAFFNYGIEFLKPLTLKDIAREIEMHESTVSRVTTGKYIGTPRGIFELKFFFSTALGGEDGGAAHSSEAVKAKIKTMIDAEDPKKILSDEKIAATLRAEDIDIARRTVAKYRESMHIPSSVQRRKQKRNQAQS